eukprot:TRINITY_DN3933_c0_g2_i2.p1 TRINITY_DN3933_c0_g2~~TRINITY_DN3933_c0_g2_i2.p1  ORF type:complete len:248 (+),score=38.44 TRINITY_DN3933_c0_g2_i2:422-1165(+)
MDCEWNTLGDMFWELWDQNNYNLPDINDKDKSFLFRVAAPFYCYSISNKSSDIQLWATYDISCLSEIDMTSFAQKYQWDCVENYESIPANNIGQIVQAARNLDPTVSPGYLVKDNENNRMTVMSPQYSCLKKLLWEHRFQNKELLMLEIIRTNTHVQFMEQFSSWSELYTTTNEKYLSFLHQLESAYNPIKHLEQNKDFAKNANQYQQLKHKLYKLRGAKVDSVREFLSTLSMDELTSIHWMNWFNR